MISKFIVCKGDTGWIPFIWPPNPPSREIKGVWDKPGVYLIAHSSYQLRTTSCTSPKICYIGCAYDGPLEQRVTQFQNSVDEGAKAKNSTTKPKGVKHDAGFEYGKKYTKLGSNSYIRMIATSRPHAKELEKNLREKFEAKNKRLPRFNKV